MEESHTTKRSKIEKSKSPVNKKKEKQSSSKYSGGQER